MGLDNALSPFGARLYTDGTANTSSAATIAALKALAAIHPAHVAGNRVMIDGDNSEWYYHPTSTLTGDDILVITPTNAAGRWLRCPGMVDLSAAIGFGTADAAVLLTFPTGARFQLMGAYWRITTTFAGGSSSAIGLSSNRTGFTVKGDILGGAAGDLTATLVSTGTQGVVAGTIGVVQDSLAEIKTGLFVAANNLLFDRITSVYTSGAGFAHIFGQLLRNPGA